MVLSKWYFLRTDLRNVFLKVDKYIKRNSEKMSIDGFHLLWHLKNWLFRERSNINALKIFPTHPLRERGMFLPIAAYYFSSSYLCTWSNWVVEIFVSVFISLWTLFKLSPKCCQNQRSIRIWFKSLCLQWNPNPTNFFVLRRLLYHHHSMFG